MLEENKKANPLDSNLPNPTDPSDPTFTYYPDSSISWTLEGTLTFLGWITITGGVIAALYLGVSLETMKVSPYTDYVYGTPHPMRWLYAAGAFMSFLCSGALMLGVGQALKYLEEIKAKLN